MSFEDLTTAELEAKLAELEATLETQLVDGGTRLVQHEGSRIEFQTTTISSRNALERRIARMRDELGRRRGRITTIPQIHVRG